MWVSFLEAARKKQTKLLPFLLAGVAPSRVNVLYLHVVLLFTIAVGRKLLYKKKKAQKEPDYKGNMSSWQKCDYISLQYACVEDERKFCLKDVYCEHIMNESWLDNL